MLFSCFTPLDLYELSDEEAAAEMVYISIVNGFGGQYDMTVGASRQEAFCYATALAVARADFSLRRAQGQAFPETACELLPVREKEWGANVRYDATMTSRREELARLMRAPRVWTDVAITEELRAALGDDFYKYRPTPIADVVRWPDNLGDQPMNLQDPNVVRKIIRITDPISLMSPTVSTVRYEIVEAYTLGASYAGITVGDKLVVEPDILGISETVTVLEVFDDGRLSVAATKPHSAGALAMTNPYPEWQSTKRRSMVVLTTAAAADPAKRAKVHQVMQRAARASSEWCVVGSDDGVTTNGFRVGTTGIGTHTIGEVTL